MAAGYSAAAILKINPMAGLTDLVKNFKTLNINQEIQIGVENQAKAFADKQRDQMLLGLKSTGKKIGKYSSQSYAAKKYSMNSRAGKGNVDLRLTGDFHAGIGVEARNEGIFFFSSDPKEFELAERYGEDIFGLTKENAAEISVKKLGPQVNKQILKHLNRV